MAISKKRATEIVEAFIAGYAKCNPEFQGTAVIGVRETAVGWLVARQSEEYKINPVVENAIIGCNPYLVDPEDGSIYEIPGEAIESEEWEGLYLEQIKGIPSPDPLANSVKEALGKEGKRTAIGLIRKSGNNFSLAEAISYVESVEGNGFPPAELAQRARSSKLRHPKIEKISGPIQLDAEPE
ncbi:hypothetical protein [Kitasatospora cineracea]|uniref:hypothetical protein n=1 Tax=Kitasatospora cineracea TaxID=88074 RepID=UPI0036C9C88E